MNIGKVEGANGLLGAPENWNKERDGPCLGLPIRLEVINGTLPAMTSAWYPTPEEIGKIVLGAPVLLRVIAESHPPVMLDVGEYPCGAAAFDGRL